jgi:ABC-type nitrate/sulfonate/bicarbonate transport system ATPase subunit
MTTPHSVGERLLSVDIKSLSFGPKLILSNINFFVDNLSRPGVQQGQIVAILGPSGCGKTQLFKCIAGLQQQAIVEGGVVMHKGYGGSLERIVPQPGDVGVVFQNYPLLPHRTVWSNIQMAARGDDKKLAHAKELANAFGIGDRLQHYPSQLSGGQRQRSAIIQQLIASEHFLLLDEPFSGLDPRAKQAACDMLRTVSLLHEHNTMVIVTHDIDCAVELADTIHILGKEENKPGATIRKTIDLIDRGIAWQPNVRKTPQFRQTVEEIIDLFKVL